MRRYAALVALLAVVSSACGGDGEDGSRFRAIALSGESQYLDGDTWRPLEEEADLAAGDRIQTGPNGRALVRLPQERTVELAPGSELEVRAPDETNLLRGSALGSTRDTLGIALGQVTVRGVAGMFRVDRSLGRVKVYQGAARLPGSGWDGTIDPLREVVVVTGGISRAPWPMSVNPDDLWDASVLGDAIEIGDRLVRLERGLERQFPDRPGSRAVARAIPGDVPTRAVRDQLRGRPVSRWAEVAVASAVASGVGITTLGDALRDMLDLRDLGASWTLIAAEWGLSEAVLESVGRLSASLARVLAAITQSQAAGGGAGGGGTSSAGTTGGTTPGGGGPAPPPDDGPGPEPPPPTGCPDGDVVCETVGGIVGNPLPTDGIG